MARRSRSEDQEFIQNKFITNPDLQKRFLMGALTAAIAGVIAYSVEYHRVNFQ